MKLFNTISVVTLAAMAAYGCGGGGGGSAPTPNGIYTGSITDGLGAPVTGDEKGIIYNNRFIVISTVLDIQQVFDAEITVSSNLFTGTVSNYDNSTIPPRFTADLSGEFVSSTSVTASFTNVNPSLVSDPGSMSLMADTSLFNKGSSAETVTGSWQGTHGNIGNATSLAIDAAGDITGNDVQGCNFTGSIVPADPSVNVYNVTLTSTGGTGCTSLPVATYTGLAWTEGSNDTTLNFSVSDGTANRTVILTKN